MVWMDHTMLDFRDKIYKKACVPSGLGVILPERSGTERVVRGDGL